MRWGFYLGNVDFLKEHQLAVCSADSRNWTQTAAATERRNPLLTKHRHKQDQEVSVKLHHPPILTPARVLLQNTQGSPLALQRSGAVPLLPPTPAAGTRLLSQEKHHPVKIGTNLNSIKDQITPMHIITQSTNYGINGA